MGAAGLPNYGGTITIEGGNVDDYDDADGGDGLGTGDIYFQGGALENTAVNASIDNPIGMQGNISLTTPASDEMKIHRQRGLHRGHRSHARRRRFLF